MISLLIFLFRELHVILAGSLGFPVDVLVVELGVHDLLAAVEAVVA